MAIILDCNYGRLQKGKVYEAKEIGPDWVLVGNLYVPMAFLSDACLTQINGAKE